MKSRPFGLVDAMLCIAAIAAALSVNRMDWRWIMGLSRRFTGQDHYSDVAIAVGVILPHLTAWTAALLVMRLLRPRPPLWRTMRRPGAMACLAASVAVIVISAYFTAKTTNARIITLDLSVNQRWSEAGGRMIISRIQRPGAMMFIPWLDRIGIAVAAAWLAQLGTGCWRPEPTRIDRLGRISSRAGRGDERWT
jgi:hypothetical protein